MGRDIDPVEHNQHVYMTNAERAESLAAYREAIHDEMKEKAICEVAGLLRVNALGSLAFMCDAFKSSFENTVTALLDPSSELTDIAFEVMLFGGDKDEDCAKLADFFVDRFNFDTLIDARVAHEADIAAEEAVGI